MKIAIMQPYLFPYIGYFQLIAAADKFIVLDDVNYIKKGWINRNRILIGGKDKLFTVPLKEASQNKKIRDIELVEDDKWKDKFLMTLKLNYNKAPYYSEAISRIEKIIQCKEVNLSSYIYNSILGLCSYLDIKTELVPSSSVYSNGDLKAQEKILDICFKEKATDYINPIGGMELYDKNSFIQSSINLNFIKSSEIVYRQFNNPFVPWLSIIDLMMFNSKESILDFITNKYNLI